MHDAQRQGDFLNARFSSIKIIYRQFNVDNNEGDSLIGYDIIIGCDLMVQIGLMVDF